LILLALVFGSMPSDDSSVMDTKTVTSNLPGDPCTESLEVCVPHWREIFEQRGSVGASLHLNHEEGLEAGAFVTLETVVPDGPADKAGLEVGDGIVSINEVEMSAGSDEELDRVLASVKVGDKIVYQVLRDGKELEITATAGAPSPQAVNMWVVFCIAETFGPSAAQEFAARNELR